MLGGCLSGLQSPIGPVRGGGYRQCFGPLFNRLFGQAKRVRP